ncbi:uncharacterized protein LOC134207991 [Armigeres subalbatus]|uniref:uncharacterized protein LOC134207991 n=1 Tax=Armigeres subalbatus TaxID=124917 RepID=UPI002ECFBD6D
MAVCQTKISDNGLNNLSEECKYGQEDAILSEGIERLCSDLGYKSESPGAGVVSGRVPDVSVYQVGIHPGRAADERRQHRRLQAPAGADVGEVENRLRGFQVAVLIPISFPAVTGPSDPVAGHGDQSVVVGVHRAHGGHPTAVIALSRAAPEYPGRPEGHMKRHRWSRN